MSTFETPKMSTQQEYETAIRAVIPARLLTVEEESDLTIPAVELVRRIVTRTEAAKEAARIHGGQNEDMRKVLRQACIALLHCKEALKALYAPAPDGELFKQIHGRLRPAGLDKWEVPAEKALTEARRFLPDLTFEPIPVQEVTLED